MIILLSPSKTLDFKNSTHIRYGSEPLFIKQSAKLIAVLKKKETNELKELMNISYKLADLNRQRYKEWHLPFNESNAKPCIAAFMGDVYEGLKAWELNDEQIEFANKHVRILSGLYGLLKPTDIIMPYRLEMGVNLKGRGYSNLYEFWGDKLTSQIKNDLKQVKPKVLVNLASAEYFKAIKPSQTGARLVTPFFMEFNNGEYKFVSFNGKKARGLMTRYTIDNQISDVEDLKLFNYEGYSYNDNKSSDDRWVFTR
jgi:uncharacterized protein